jgi:gliding motility-associated-like protein
MKKLQLGCLIIGLIVIVNMGAMAQFAATINQQVNSCNRVLTVNVTGGSGNYQYAWGSSGGCGTPANYSQPSLTISNCGSDGTHNVFVRDVVTNALTFASANVTKSISGTMSMWYPNVFTPNGDGSNDTFDLSTASQGTGPTNIHTLSIEVKNRWGAVVHNQTFTNYATGLIAHYPLWNGGNNSAGTYYIAITASNCTTSSPYNGQIQLLR